jgi:predicted glycogen debranching enzyme
MLELGPEICSDRDGSFAREWLETNGIGGYASATISGANTRRYHGLLVAATRPPLGRVVMLSKFEETVTIGGQKYELSSNQYPGIVHPEGFRYLKGFRLDPFPIWTYEIEGVEIERSIFMIHGENSTVCRWKVTNRTANSNSNIELELKPLVAFRDHHHLRREITGFEVDYRVDDDVVSIQPHAEMPRLYLAHNAKAIEHQGHWYRDLEYAIEQERGFDFHEDLFQPFSLSFDLAEEAILIASTEQKSISEAEEMQHIEIKRRAALVVRSEINDKTLWPLVLAADQFIVERGTGKSVIAGYHWFSDWGRDSMIALPGLTLATNRPDIAKSIITEFSKHISEGMLPNRFPDAGETPEYNTVDATLWYFEAIRAYIENTGDHEFVKDVIYDNLVDIIDSHISGTRYAIKVDTDGLLNAGVPGTQLTWMDAKIGDWVITPRRGKAVEIQALWYNALCTIAGFANDFGDSRRQKVYRTMAAKAKTSFREQFWNDQEDCLFDVIDGAEKDGSIRPNQIFAVSLPNSMLDAATARNVVNKVETDLLTPFGLRSLSPHDPRYVPTYIGSPFERDGAYHQGPVWGWLIGPFVDAYRKTHSKDAMAEKRIDEILERLKAHLGEAMIGQVSEIFDGDLPHIPRGCAAQAWSVAELLRVSRKSTL